jgi:hypothetical protein
MKQNLSTMEDAQRVTVGLCREKMHSGVGYLGHGLVSLLVLFCFSSGQLIYIR